MKKIVYFSLLHILFPLVLGSLAYFLLRAEAVLLLDWVGMRPAYAGNGQETNFLYQIAAYNLPDALWLYAFLATFSIIWGNSSVGKRWQIGVYMLAIGSEIAQYQQWIQGTGDWTDITAYTLAFFIYFFIVQNKQQQWIFSKKQQSKQPYH